MQFTAPAPLTAFGRISRSALIIALLIGSLTPTIGGYSVVPIAAGLAVPVVIYEVLRFLPKLHPVVLFVVPLFGVLASHALFVAPATEYGADKLSKFLTLTLASALVACLLRDGRSVVTFARAWVAVTVVLAALSLAGWEGSGRSEVFESNPIWLGRALAAGVLAAIWLAWRKTNPRLMLLAAAVLLVGLLATGSRGPLVGVIIGAVVLSVAGQSVRISRVLGILAAGVLGIFAVQTLPFLREGRLAQILAGNDVTDQTRNIFLDVTLPLIAQAPGGVGFGNWALSVSVPRQFLWPHNLFLEVFAELGILTGLFLMAVLVAVVVRLLRRTTTNPGASFVLAALTAETFSVCVSGDLNARTFFFLLTLGFLAGSKSPLMGLDPDKEPAGKAVPVRARSL